ncbi:MAG: DUF3369 domain-containing protein [Stagnimonas sp.]|nr:DUF3369 domain-containing protein [Stagnimonas sp.]
MSDELSFAAESTLPSRAQRARWKLLIVDDEVEVHQVTELALADFRFAGRGLEFLHAYSAAEARRILGETPDIAVVLLDVVMESEHAGLEVVEYIRNVLGNRFLRLVLRTGQPGQAPELEMITNYDINDYKYKTELTRERLFSTVYTSLSVYRDLMALEASRKGLEKVIEASAHIFELHSVEAFTQGVLEQLTALLFLDRDAVIAHADGLAAADDHERYTIVAATGSFSGLVGARACASLPTTVVERIRAALSSSEDLFGEDYYVGVQSIPRPLVFYVTADVPISLTDRRAISLFHRNVALAHQNLTRIAASNPAI